MEDMLSQLDQIYMEDGGVTGDEMLAEAYKWIQEPKKKLQHLLPGWTTKLEKQRYVGWPSYQMKVR